jgi:Mce-associated membrane protein
VTTSSFEADASASASPAPPRAPVALIASLVVLLVLLAAAALVGAVKLRDAGQRDDARAAALAAARQEALNLTSIDGKDIDADLKRVQDGATGGFAKDFAQRANDLKSVLTANAVVAEGRVIDAALVRGDLDTATVLVVVDSTVKNKAVPSGRANTYRMQLDLERHGGRWLTSALQFVG